MKRPLSLALASAAGLALVYGTACSSGGGGSNTGGTPGQTGGISGQTGGSSGQTGGGSGTTGGSNGKTGGGSGTTGGSGQTGGGSGTTGGGSGTTGGSNGTGGNAGTGGGSVSTRPNGCPVADGLISDFEENDLTMAVIKSPIAPGGYWGSFKDMTSGATMTMAIESSGTANCDKYALHVQGSGFKDWGAGIEMALKYSGTDAAKVPQNVDVSAYSGLQFKVKTGPNHSARSPVRVAWATLDSEPGTDNRGGMCTGDTTDCANHVGRFLRTGTPFAAGSDWSTVTMCFDSDFMAMYVPEYVPAATRRDIAKRFLKLQFLTNKDQDPTSTSTTNSDPYKGDKFDFWLDNIQLIKGPCQRPVFKSTDSAKVPFPQNKAPGSCSIIPNAAGYNAVLTDMYNGWKSRFVKPEGSGLKVVAVEQSGMPWLSEGMGYGMLIAAAMGDKTTFDGIWNTTKAHLTGGLLGWQNGSGGSATDGDEDIALGLLIADKQWGGTYKADATAMISQIKSKDFSGSTMKAGENFAPFNPSYFSPAAYRAFGSDWSSIITTNYPTVTSCGSMGLPTDWCNNGQPSNAKAVGANVTNTFCTGSACPSLYADDAARIPWRVGMDACLNASADGKAIVNKILTTLKLSGTGGAKAGSVYNAYTPTGSAYTGAVQNQASFIGALAVGAMADSGNAAALENASRSVFDINDLPTYNQKYYSSSLAILTMLFTTGNFPMP